MVTMIRAGEALTRKEMEALCAFGRDVTLKELGVVIGIAKSTCSKWVLDSQFPSYRIDGRWMIRVADMTDWTFPIRRGGLTPGQIAAIKLAAKRGIPWKEIAAKMPGVVSRTVYRVYTGEIG